MTTETMETNLVFLTWVIVALFVLFGVFVNIVVWRYRQLKKKIDKLVKAGGQRGPPGPIGLPADYMLELWRERNKKGTLEEFIAWFKNQIMAETNLAKTPARPSSDDQQYHRNELYKKWRNITGNEESLRFVIWASRQLPEETYLVQVLHGTRDDENSLDIRKKVDAELDKLAIQVKESGLPWEL